MGSFRSPVTFQHRISKDERKMLFSPRSIRNLIIFTLVLAPYLCLAVPNNGDINFIPLNFDEIKNKLFDSENFMNLTQFKYNLDSRDIYSRYDDQACIEELTAIGMSLRNFEFWAIKRNLNFNIEF